MKTVFCLFFISLLIAGKSDKKEYNIGITTESGYKDVKSIDDEKDHKTVPNGDMNKMDPNKDVYIMIGDTKRKGKVKSKVKEKKKNNQGLMVGLFIGFLILVITGATIGYLYWKQKQNKKNQNKTTKTPFEAEPKISGIPEENAQDNSRQTNAYIEPSHTKDSL